MTASRLAAFTELFSWHGFDVPVPAGRRFELTVHMRVRTRHEFGYLDESRVGPVLRWKASPRVIPLAGFYFQPQQVYAGRYLVGWRYFGGVEAPFRLSAASVFTTRLVTERFAGAGRPHYNRYRTYERLALGRGRVVPYLQNEFLAVRQGFQAARNSGGLQIRLGPKVMLDAAYLYEIRRAAWGGDRQAIVTSIQWRPRGR